MANPLTRTVYVVVAVRITCDVDPHDVIADCDYRFTADGIVETEIVGVSDADDTRIP
jgi:hypothetical protein